MKLKSSLAPKSSENGTVLFQFLIANEHIYCCKCLHLHNHFLHNEALIHYKSNLATECCCQTGRKCRCKCSSSYESSTHRCVKAWVQQNSDLILLLFVEFCDPIVNC